MSEEQTGVGVGVVGGVGWNSDDEDDPSEHCPGGGQEASLPELQGVLSKWTNYIHGWQSRFIVFRDGTLSYYKSEHDTEYGCRGAIGVSKATVKPHELDECRFDVSVNDCVWYLRAESTEEKQQWLDVLEAYKAESGYGSDNNLKRHGSAVSLTSTTLSTTSGSSFKKCRGLKEKLAEMETFRDILCQQIETLQKYFDTCAEHENITSKRTNEDQPDGKIESEVSAIDFKGEAMTFRATTAGVLATLQHCVDLMGQREDSWRRRFDREVERRRRAEELHRIARQELALTRRSHAVHGSPDYEEGPHSALPDEEFYDAVETGLDKIEEEADRRERIQKHVLFKQQDTEKSTSISKVCQHKLWPEIERITMEQLHYARLGVGQGSGSGGWQLFAEDGDMKMYRREEEMNGMVVDPLKACHMVKGVTGREVCHYFFAPDVRYEWETTLEQMTVVETIAEDTLVFLQVHKRIWPASQRDALFWSHMRRVEDSMDKDGHDLWIVANHSTEHPEFPSNSGKCVRVFLTVSLVCQTIVDPPKDGKPVSRDDITCKITYCSVVNPGGWAPASVLRAVYKREYPKFLKRFTAYVIDRCKNNPILF